MENELPNEVKLNLKINPLAMQERPNLAVHIAGILSSWAEIEDELAILFGFSLGTQPAVAASVLGCVTNVATRLDMIETAIRLNISEASGSKFQVDLSPKIRKIARRRNNVVHCIWTTHDKYPSDLIRFEGLSSPNLFMEKWKERDFLELKLAVMTLHLEIKSFSQALISDRAPSNSVTKESHWTVSPLDSKEEDDLELGHPNHRE